MGEIEVLVSKLVTVDTLSSGTVVGGEITSLSNEQVRKTDVY
jgi:hypothetical protein